jgi:hypothetical protein
MPLPVTTRPSADPEARRHLAFRQAKVQTEHAQASAYVLIKLPLFG